jgi:hypothetical protein
LRLALVKQTVNELPGVVARHVKHVSLEEFDATLAIFNTNCNENQHCIMQFGS